MPQRLRHWKLRKKNDLASSETFSPLHRVTQLLLESKEVRLELKKGDSLRLQKERVKFIALRSHSKSTQNLVISRHSCARMAKHVQQSVMYFQSYCFAHKTYCILDDFRCPSPS